MKNYDYDYDDVKQKYWLMIRSSKNFMDAFNSITQSVNGDIEEDERGLVNILQIKQVQLAYESFLNTAELGIEELNSIQNIFESYKLRNWHHSDERTNEK